MSFPERSLTVLLATVPALAFSAGGFAAPDLKAECAKALAGRYGNRAHITQVSPVISAVTGFAVDGLFELGTEGPRRFTCTFVGDGKLQGLVIRPSD